VKWLKLAREVVPIVQQVVRGARSLAEARRRLVDAAAAGTFDKALRIAAGTRVLVDEYIERG
jgi:hypothetical protein